ncbi:hypothetical protein SAMN02745673_02364 [Marinactinospora thermotolerans DSM 45154]|uniref:Uncharacterized protein n=1 Tax=Marinactinospora thermotolerans DSM 45154 TaxID=1122192 RepID=A0A1T4QQA4_9ACTN|nr:hypothetical protein SAMN02745673_02364 [Marinactinospora thermotolerans DSM 45154]
MAKDNLPPEGNQIDPVNEAARESGRRVADLFRALWELLRALFGRNSSRAGGAEPRQSGRGPMGDRAAARPQGDMGPPARPRIGYWRGLTAAARGVVVAVRGVVSAAGELRRAFRARREERRRAGSSEAPGRAGRSGRSSGRPSRSPGSTPAWQRPLIAAAAVAGRVWRGSARAFAGTRNLFRSRPTAGPGRAAPSSQENRRGAGEADPRPGQAPPSSPRERAGEPPENPLEGRIVRHQGSDVSPARSAVRDVAPLNGEVLRRARAGEGIRSARNRPALPAPNRDQRKGRS